MTGISFALAVVILVVLMGSLRRNQRETKTMFLLSPLLLTAAIIIWGVIMFHDTKSQSLAPRWPLHIIGGLLILHLPLAFVLVQRSKGHRWFACFVIALELFCSLVAAFVASMAVTGDWL